MLPAAPKGPALLVDKAFAPNLTAYVVYPPLRGVQGRLKPARLALCQSICGLALFMAASLHVAPVF